MTATTAPSQLPVLDAQGVMRAMGDFSGDIYREVGEVFLEDLPSMRRSLRTAEGSAEALIPALHELANSLGVVGAQRGEALVRDLERRLRDGETLELEAVAATVHRTLKVVEQALRAVLAAPGGGPVA